VRRDRSTQNGARWIRSELLMNMEHNEGRNNEELLAPVPDILADYLCILADKVTEDVVVLSFGADGCYRQ